MPKALPTGAAQAVSRRWAVCLCAAWCDVCRDYHTVFESLAPSHPAWHFVWLDVEDQAHLLQDIDVETFPTLVLLSEKNLEFFGPLTPQAASLSRLLQNFQVVAVAASADVQRPPAPSTDSIASEWQPLVAFLQTLAPST